jgi:hypothetical protein
VYVFVCVCVCCMYVCMCVLFTCEYLTPQRNLFMHVWLYSCMSVCVCMYVYVYTHVCVEAYLHVYTVRAHAPLTYITRKKNSLAEPDAGLLAFFLPSDRNTSVRSNSVFSFAAVPNRPQFTRATEMSSGQLLAAFL